ncbi:hypothetical protein ACIOC1_03980 [Streptomyces sp. NPDC088197]|uniref:hypothetical protein n=1 Tax=Streptomyces sp. NPDC088197 TaxID=3365840 RepID=UPI0038236CBC
MTGTGSLRRALPLAALIVLLAAAPGYAFDDTGLPPSGGKGSGGKGSGDSGGNLEAIAQGYRLTYPTGRPSGASRPLASVNVNWAPPPCWFGPKYTPEQFKAEYTKNFNDELPQVHGTFRTAMGMDRDHYQNGLDYPGGDKGYKDFNSAEAGKGMWWLVTVNPDADPSAQMGCNDQTPRWVPNGQMPPAGTGHVITPEMLSKLAFAHTHVPGVRIVTNPAGPQTVNIPTWVTLRQAYTPVKVRASVDLGGGREIWAETTAEPSAVHITPGTSDATVFPSSGDCPIGPDGKVGAAYNGDPKAAPPCGVTYLRSTQNTPPYQLNVSVNWHVSWTGSSGGPYALPDGRVGDPREVTVREIQTINN